MEEADVQGAINAIKEKGGKILTKKAPKAKPVREYHSSSEDEEDTEKNDESKLDGESTDDSSSDEEEKVQDSRKRKKKGKKLVLTPEELALGQEMIKSKKARRDIIDSGWNR